MKAPSTSARTRWNASLGQNTIVTTRPLFVGAAMTALPSRT